MFVRPGWGVAIAATTLLLSGCTVVAPAENGDGQGGNADSELRIYAAASLIAPFDELAAGFAAEFPHVTVLPTVYDGSSTLAVQLMEGAPADVFASADEATMATVAGLLESPATVFATNTLMIAVAPGNPLGITGLADLAGDLTLVLCAPMVPCGAAAERLLTLDGVDVTPVSEEQNVTAVLTKVRSGEADAGLVYVTDVAAAGKAVSGVSIPGTDMAANSYLIGVLRDASDSVAADAFVEWVVSPAGQTILARYGFGTS